MPRVNATAVQDPAAKAADEAERRAGARTKLMEAAGPIFAERGLEGATGKEIAERAGVNAAAVNYHFGGMEGLYEAVLLEARTRLVASEALAEVMTGPGSAEDRLRALIRLVVRAALERGSGSWSLRLLSREAANPSAVGVRLLVSQAQPHVGRLRAIVGAIIGRSADEPATALACISVLAPLQFLLIADHKLVSGVHPALDLAPQAQDALAEHFHRFAMAGLHAMRAGSAG
jgi:AcrR family transcriptional regulator